MMRDAHYISLLQDLRHYQLELVDRVSENAQKLIAD